MGQHTSATTSQQSQPSFPVSMLHTLAYCWVGGIAIALDEIESGALSPGRFVDRGEALEQSLVKQWWRLVAGTHSGARRLSRTLLSPITWTSTRVQQRTWLAEEELEHQIEMALDRLGIPSRERLLQLADEIDALTQRIDAELARELS